METGSGLEYIRLTYIYVAHPLLFIAVAQSALTQFHLIKSSVILIVRRVTHRIIEVEWTGR